MKRVWVELAAGNEVGISGLAIQTPTRREVGAGPKGVSKGAGTGSRQLAARRVAASLLKDRQNTKHLPEVLQMEELKTGERKYFIKTAFRRANKQKRRRVALI